MTTTTHPPTTETIAVASDRPWQPDWYGTARLRLDVFDQVEDKPRADLARQIGVTVPTLRRYMNGETTPEGCDAWTGGGTLGRIATVLGRRMVDILEFRPLERGAAPRPRESESVPCVVRRPRTDRRAQPRPTRRGRRAHQPSQPKHQARRLHGHLHAARLRRLAEPVPRRQRAARSRALERLAVARRPAEVEGTTRDGELVRRAGGPGRRGRDRDLGPTRRSTPG